MLRYHTSLEQFTLALAAVVCTALAWYSLELFPPLPYVFTAYLLILIIAFHLSGEIPKELCLLTAQRNARQTLVVILHAYTKTPEDMSGVIEKVTHSFQSRPDYFCPLLPIHRFSYANPNQIVIKLLSRISDIVGEEADQKYEKIVFVGHSAGALLARKTYICACGETTTSGGLFAPFEPEFTKSKEANYWWANRVSRIILLAGMNRGWSISHHLSMKLAIAFTLMQTVGRILNLPRWPLLIYSFRRGSPWITNLRIQWLAMRRRARQEKADLEATGRKDFTKISGLATTIQLLGSKDDYVSPEDNVDLVSGGDFIYLDVPYSGHVNVIRMGSNQASELEQQRAADRAKVFKTALIDEASEIETILPTDKDSGLPTENTAVKNVIFVMHGIRDDGYWTHKLARRAKAKIGDRVETKTSTYGYFPMWPFLLPWKRDQKVEWLMEQYAECLALYPNAEFSYVGHSNGTYLLAAAFNKYSCVRFKHIVFAGSVVQRGYHWDKLFKEGRVVAVLNYVATADWVVAWFPKVFQWIPIQGLGSAGHNGFSAQYANWRLFLSDFRRWKASTLPDNLKQFRYIQGGHSAGRMEDQWDNIATFLETGTVTSIKNYTDNNEWWTFPRGVTGSFIAVIGCIPIVIWIFLIGGIIYGACLINSIEWSGWEKMFLTIYFLGIWKLLNKL
ncbi:MAG: hypothetical protein U0412_06175 [Nitrospira sp.]